MQTVRSAIGEVHESLSLVQVEEGPTMNAESMEDALIRIWLKLCFLFGEFIEVMMHFGGQTSPEQKNETRVEIENHSDNDA